MAGAASGEAEGGAICRCMGGFGISGVAGVGVVTDSSRDPWEGYSGVCGCMGLAQRKENQRLTGAVEVTVQTISRGEIRVSGLSPMDGSLLDRYAEAPMACGRV